MFNFKQFSVSNERSAMKISTDGVLLGAWTPVPSVTPGEIWDIGSGTGLIALMAAQRFPDAHVTAIEIDSDAADEAAYNFSISPWKERLTLVKGDIMELESTLPKPNLIISNPPFYNESIKAPDERRNIARHESGLSVESLIDISSKVLEKGGNLAFIAPYSRKDDIEYFSTLRKMIPTHFSPVIMKAGNIPTRILVNLTKGIAMVNVDCSPLIIRNSTNYYTDTYRSLTNDFYTHLK